MYIVLSVVQCMQGQSVRMILFDVECCSYIRKDF